MKGFCLNFSFHCHQCHTCLFSILQHLGLSWHVVNMLKPAKPLIRGYWKHISHQKLTQFSSYPGMHVSHHVQHPSCLLSWCFIWPYSIQVWRSLLCKIQIPVHDFSKVNEVLESEQPSTILSVLKVELHTWSWLPIVLSCASLNYNLRLM